MTRKQFEIDVLRFKDYKVFLASLLERESASKKGLKSSLSEAMGCQLSYLSRVLNGDAHLSPEQAEAATRYFFLSPQQSSYFMALVAEARAGTETLRQYWQNQQRQILDEQLQLHSRVSLRQPLSDLQMTQYYSDWHYAAIHVITGIPRFRTVESIAKGLRLSTNVVREALQFLLSAQLVERKRGVFYRTQAQLHLPKDSPLLRQYNTNLKLHSLTEFANRRPHDFRYASVMTLSKADFLKLKELFLETVEKARATIANSEDEIAAMYMFDLFEITHER